MLSNIDVTEYRRVEHPIDAIFINRWSPRAMSGEKMTQFELMPLFEAARWAPSSYNGQPWRFLYAQREDEHWHTFFNLLGKFNQSWVRKAAVLIVVVSRKTFERNDKPARTHSFDAGAAWQNLALQAALNGLVAHGMQGFDYERARQDLNIPDHFNVEAMIAVGKPGVKEELPEELQEKEKPSDRKPVSEIVIRGKFMRDQ